MATCAKIINGVTCGKQDVSLGIVDEATGEIHWYCQEHVWERSPAGEGETCSILSGPYRSRDRRCGRPAVIKSSHPDGGLVDYYCAQCRREHLPSEAEKVADAAKAARRKEAHAGMTGCLLLLLTVGLLVGGIVALFIHPLLTLLAAILIAIIWHGFHTSGD